MKPSDKQRAAFTRVLVLGFPGTGKSTLVAQLAERYNLIWITLDNDADVIFKLPREWQDRVDIIDIPDTATLPMASRTLLQLFKEKKGSICNTHGAWKCPLCNKRDPTNVSPVDFTALTQRDIVVIDTISQLGKSFLAHTLKDQSIDYKPERDDWGALRRWTEFMQSEIQGAHFNIVCVAHLIDAELKDKTTKMIPDFGSKSMGMAFGKAFSHVIQCDIINKKHKAFSSSIAKQNINLKSRTDFQIELLSEPSLLPIFDELLNHPPVEETQQPETPSQAITPSQTPSAKSLSDLQAMAVAMRNKGATK